MSKEDFVSFEQAKRLKKVGFDWNCNHYIDERGKISENTKDDFFCSCYENLNDANFALHDKSGNLLDYCSAPTLAQVCKWLREKHNIHIQIESVIGKRWTYDVVDIKPIQDISGEYISRMPERVGYPVINTYEQAQSVGIDVALGMLENKNEQQ